LSVVQGDTGLGIEDGGGVVAVHVGGDNLILGVGEYALHGGLGRLLDNGLDLIVGSTLLDAAGKVDNGEVGGWDTHGHSSELPFRSGMTFPTALAAPVLDGMMF